MLISYLNARYYIYVDSILFIYFNKLIKFIRNSNISLIILLVDYIRNYKKNVLYIYNIYIIYYN